MSELAEILQRRARGDAAQAVLATIVNVSGSSYRRVGAHMLVMPNGETIGNVSGGCLEQDVIAHAEQVRMEDKPRLLTYDTTAEEDVLFGVGLGCQGVIEIWIEPIARAEEMLNFCERLLTVGECGTVATVFRGTDTGERTFWRGPSEHKRSSARTDTDGFGIFYEVIQPPIRLLVFGGGYDAIPLVRLARQLNYEIAVIDRRPAYATRERFPDASEIHLKAAADLPAFSVTPRTAAVIMSHHYLTDRENLRALLPLPLKYLGLMGPQRRSERMLQELRAEGFAASEEMLRKLHTPIGLDIGAEGPHEIALAILAEMNAVFSGHGGGILREKKGPIHAPRSERF